MSGLANNTPRTMADSFQKEVERRMTKKPMDYTPHERRFGYPVIPADKYEDTTGWNLQEFMQKNKHVAGMAMGAGSNDTEDFAPRSIVVNPYNEHMKDPQKREGLLLIEAARHMMDEEGYRPNFKITPEMQQWRKKTFAPDEPYAYDDNAFRQTLVSRVIANDIGPNFVPADIRAAADAFKKRLIALDK